jgi:hypothetical protein
MTCPNLFCTPSAAHITLTKSHDQPEYDTAEWIDNVIAKHGPPQGKIGAYSRKNSPGRTPRVAIYGRKGREERKNGFPVSPVDVGT